MALGFHRVYHRPAIVDLRIAVFGGFFCWLHFLARPSANLTPPRLAAGSPHGAPCAANRVAIFYY